MQTIMALLQIIKKRNDKLIIILNTNQIISNENQMTKPKKLAEYKMAGDVSEDIRELMEFEHENRDKINEIIDVINQLKKYLKNL